MKKKIYNIFINSSTRDLHEPIYDFNMVFPQGNIKANNDEYININVMSFDMMNTMYNVNSYTSNNTFTLKRTDADGISNPVNTTITIPYGNYSVFSFKDQLNVLLNGIITVNYNTAQNTYTYTKVASSYRYFIIPLNATKLLGISNTTEIPVGGYTGTFVNMVNFNKIIIRCGNLNFDYNTYENLKNTNSLFDNSNILFWKSKQDVEPFKMISYNNEDASNSYVYNLYNNDIDYLNLQLTNENGEAIKDAPDYLLLIQFTVLEKNRDTVETLLKKILVSMNNIAYYILEGLKYIGVFSF